MTGKNWGTDVIAPEKWIAPAKQYRTKSGKRVIGLEVVLKNSTGAEVTFPVKGSIVTSEKPFRTLYHIWTLDGRSSVLKESGLDLVKAE